MSSMYVLSTIALPARVGRERERERAAENICQFVVPGKAFPDRPQCFSYVPTVVL